MDFKKAIEAHVNWKAKLKTYINKPDRSLSPAVVRQPDRCELGQWLSGEGQKHAHLAEFTALVSHHTRFHDAAATVIEKADRGLQVTEEVSLIGSSPFSTESNAVVRSIKALQSKI